MTTFFDNRHYDVADPILRKAKRLVGGATSTCNRYPELKGSTDIDEPWVLDKLNLGKCDGANIDFRYGDTDLDELFEPSLLRAYSKTKRHGFEKGTTRIVTQLYKKLRSPLRHEEAEKWARVIAQALEDSGAFNRASGSSGHGQVAPETPKEAL